MIPGLISWGILLGMLALSYPSHDAGSYRDRFYLSVVPEVDLT